VTANPVPPVSVRPRSLEQLERWRAAAAYFPKLSFSEYLRRLIDDGAIVELNARRADRLADERFRRLGELTPPEIDERRERGLDDWPEVDPDDDWLDREADEKGSA
jgi:hypothetical protein